MPEGIKVAEAYVDLKARLDESSLKRAGAAIRNTMSTTTNRFGVDLGNSIKRATTSQLSSVSANISKQLGKAGEQGGTSFASGLAKKVVPAATSAGSKAGTGFSSGFRKGAAPAHSVINEFSKGMANLSTRIGITSFQLQMMGAYATAAFTGPALIGLTQFAKTGLQFATSIDYARASLNSLLKQGTDVEGLIKNLQKISIESPLINTTDVVDYAQKLAASGVQAEDLTKTLRALNNIFLTQGVAGPDRARLALLAYTQILSKGTIGMDDLRQQFAEHVPGGIKIFQAVLKELGYKSIPEANEALKGGELTMEQVNAEFIKMGSSGKYLEGATKASQTLGGVWQSFKENMVTRIGNAFDRNRAVIIDSIKKVQPAVESFIDYLVSKIPSAVKFVGSLADKFKVLAQVFENLSPAQKDMVAGLAGMAALSGPLLVLSGALGTVASSLFNMLSFFGVGAAGGGAGGAIASLGGAILGIGVAVGVIVGVFALAYTKSEEFRKSLGEWIKTAGEKLNEWLIPALKDLWETLKDVGQFMSDEDFKRFATIIGVTLVAGLVAAVAAIKVITGAVWYFIKVVGFLKGVISNVVKVITGTWKAIGIAIGAVFYFITKVVWPGIKAALSGIGAAFTWVYNTVIKPIMGAFGFAFSVAMKIVEVFAKTIWIALVLVGRGFKILWHIVIKPILGFIGAGIMFLWKAVIAPVFMAIWKYIGGPLKTAFNFLSQHIQRSWTLIKAAVISAWTFLRDKAFNPIKNMVMTVIPKAFKSMKDAVILAWEAMKNAAKLPVKFMIETVLNKGIIGGVNWVADKVGMKPKPYIKPVPLPFAKGGVAPGIGSKDTVPAMLTPGEGILTKDEMKKLGGPRGFAHLRENIALDGVQFFNDGGIVGGIKKAWQTFTNPYEALKGAATKSLSKLPGVGAIWDLGKATALKLVGGLKDWFTSKLGGFIGAGGTTGMGSKMMTAALKAVFPSANVISGDRPGAMTLTGHRSYHSMGRALDIAPVRAIAAWIRATFGAKTKELITPWQELNLHNGKPHQYTGAVWNQHNFAGGNAHIHWAMDNGGAWPTGTARVNMSGETENVLTGAQSRALEERLKKDESGYYFGDLYIDGVMQEGAVITIKKATSALRAGTSRRS